MGSMGGQRRQGREEGETKGLKEDQESRAAGGTQRRRRCRKEVWC